MGNGEAETRCVFLLYGRYFRIGGNRQAKSVTTEVLPLVCSLNIDVSVKLMRML